MQLTEMLDNWRSLLWCPMPCPYVLTARLVRWLEPRAARRVSDWENWQEG